MIPKKKNSISEEYNWYRGFSIGGEMWLIIENLVKFKTYNYGV